MNNLVHRCLLVSKEKIYSLRLFSLSRKHLRKTTIRSVRQPNRWDFQEQGYILLSIPLFTLGLGTWQVQRRQWKLRLIEELEQKTKSNPVPLPENTKDLSNMEYSKVRVRGHFDHSQELYIGPRPLIQAESDRGGGLFSVNRPTPGSNVVTAFHLTDRDETILVNRGWVPKERLDPRTRPEGQISDEVELVGVIRKTEKRTPGAPKKPMINNQYLRRDINLMSQQLNTETVFLDADFDSTVPGGPVGGQTRVTLRNEHLAYIFTWYTLTAFTFAMWYKKYWLRRI